MSKKLPPKPSIEQLKKQAKDLLKAHKSADSGAATRIRAFLPRLSEAAEEDILAADLSLQEAQHVLACEYGFKSWNWLQAVIEVDLDLLVKVTEREIQTLMRETDQKDLVIALKGASEEFKDKVTGNMSERVRTFILQEAAFLGSMPQDEIEEVQRRILLQAAQLAVRGQISWPNGGEDRALESGDNGPTPLVTQPRLGELLEKDLGQLIEGELVEVWEGLAEQARRGGILSLEPCIASAKSSFIKEAVILAVDGTEPNLIRDVLETRCRHAILPGRKTRGLMVIEGLLAIMAGDNPEIIRHKLSALYLDSQVAGSGGGATTLRPPKEIVAEIERSLVQQPLMAMGYDELSTLITDMGYLARQAGIRAACELVGKAEDPLLHRGLEMIAAKEEPDRVIEALEAQLEEGLCETEMRLRMSIVGIMAIQEGKRPSEVAAMVKQAAA
jgi:flagellar motor component MotA